jgi:hypothetical protein
MAAIGKRASAWSAAGMAIAIHGWNTYITSKNGRPAAMIRRSDPTAGATVAVATMGMAGAAVRGIAGGAIAVARKSGAAMCARQSSVS